MTVDFYRLDRAPAAVPLAPDLRIAWWQPDRDGLPSRGSRRPVNYWWWALARMGAFSRRGFAELRIEREGRVVHRLIVTPRWYRFPFMGADDLQIGDVWTAPEARRQQLARIAIAEAQRRFGADGTAIWYVVDARNRASAELARSCGYRHAAVGRRTRRLGLSLLGQYVVDRLV
jgi:ribosomal protein S18 acetylase RimI-like enzyme